MRKKKFREFGIRPSFDRPRFGGFHQRPRQMGFRNFNDVNPRFRRPPFGNLNNQDREGDRRLNERFGSQPFMYLLFFVKSI